MNKLKSKYQNQNDTVKLIIHLLIAYLIFQFGVINFTNRTTPVYLLPLNIFSLFGAYWLLKFTPKSANYLIDKCQSIADINEDIKTFITIAYLILTLALSYFFCVIVIILAVLLICILIAALKNADLIPFSIKTIINNISALTILLTDYSNNGIFIVGIGSYLQYRILKRQK